MFNDVTFAQVLRDAQDFITGELTPTVAVILVFVLVVLGVKAFNIYVEWSRYDGSSYQGYHYQYHYQHHYQNEQKDYCYSNCEKNDYSVLGLTPSATLTEVKKAYRQLVKKYHPDAGGDPEMFKLIHAAYQNIVGGRVNK